MVRVFQLLTNNNMMIISMSRDFWGYISRGVFIQKVKQTEVGSSTMPHKVNPIDFENAEGNLGISNAYLNSFVELLNHSRFQGDYTENSVYENVGCSLGYVFVAYESLLKGCDKLVPNRIGNH
eukprot:CAMPEP_0170513572 /NCGR_PEP_ID=MMETSP0209-20121228/98_1 /TAXON_ID=665100 ORGANISM="Litonotus pictus, Strain P1" /NCGR_SAMPLE_ID=MMETSP0209 /ASSEMBLY_ACC=CAM_ASM_000301 /LENGTH=122 /DNA_ID=CAMNT_0010797325 /DNA_START=24 /DNA_END=392 /DNA_ORIENTATION=+